jgi:type I restriction enzyme S subunit
LKRISFKNLISTLNSKEYTTLDEVASLQKKTWKPSDKSEILEHYSIPAYDENKMPSFENSTTIHSNKTIVTPDCILVSKLNPENKRVWRPLCISDNAVCSTEFLAIIPKSEKYSQYIYGIIDSDEYTEYLVNNVTGSTGSRQRVQPKTAMQ